MSIDSRHSGCQDCWQHKKIVMVKADKAMLKFELNTMLDDCRAEDDRAFNSFLGLDRSFGRIISGTWTNA